MPDVTISTMNLTEADIQARIAAGLVTERSHPDGGLRILNYTPRAQYSNTWDNVTRQCRGLILEGERVVARSVPKFFNHNQPGADDIALEEAAVVMDKVDGSLGVIYSIAGEYRVATRGSFTSPQAAEATVMLRGMGYEPPPGLTVLVEIVYPQNRIVLDYGDKHALILLGAVDNQNGASVFVDDPRLASWPGERVEVLPYNKLVDALLANPRPNAEGLVVMSADGQRRLKIKQEDYVRLHKILSGLTNVSVWEALKAGDTERLYEVAPDELHPWLKATQYGLEAAYADLIVRWEQDFRGMCSGLGESPSRKAFAGLATQHACPGAMFALLDGRDEAVADAAWKVVRPADRTSPTNATSSE